MPDDFFDEEPAWEIIPSGYQQANAPPPKPPVSLALVQTEIDFDEEPDEFFADDFGNDDFVSLVVVPSDSQPITDQADIGAY